MVVDKAKFIAVERKPQMIPVWNEFVVVVVASGTAVVFFWFCCLLQRRLVASFYCPRHWKKTGLLLVTLPCFALWFCFCFGFSFYFFYTSLPTPSSPTPSYLSQPECNFFRLELTCFSDFGQQHKVLRQLDMYICCRVLRISAHSPVDALSLVVCVYVCVCVLYLVLYFELLKTPRRDSITTTTFALNACTETGCRAEAGTPRDRIASPRFAIVIVNSSNSCLSCCCCCCCSYCLAGETSRQNWASSCLCFFDVVVVKRERRACESTKRNRSTTILSKLLKT